MILTSTFQSLNFLEIAWGCGGGGVKEYSSGRLELVGREDMDHIMGTVSLPRSSLSIRPS